MTLVTPEESSELAKIQDEKITTQGKGGPEGLVKKRKTMSDYIKEREDGKLSVGHQEIGDVKIANLREVRNKLGNLAIRGRQVEDTLEEWQHLKALYLQVFQVAGIAPDHLEQNEKIAINKIDRAFNLPVTYKDIE